MTIRFGANSKALANVCRMLFREILLKEEVPQFVLVE